MFLDAAIESGADCLVTGDTDLLSLDAIEGTRIVTPARFIAELD